MKPTAACVKSIHVSGFCSICGQHAVEPAHLVTDASFALSIRCREHCGVHRQPYSEANR